jgi:GAF domain-containing protein
MENPINIPENATKETIYSLIIPQIEALLSSETDLVANLANVSAVLKESFSFFWVGFYLVKQGELVLGPFQGPVACTRIKYGKGVCGNAWQTAQVVIVPDVDSFPGHIVCSSLSRSEIVLPLVKNGVVLGVLDIDSEQLNSFDEIDARELQIIVQLIEEKM